MERLNCWEFKRCGREVGGKKVSEFGICPASTDTLLEGVHGGICAGRACWVVAGTMCGRKVQGSFAQKYLDCGLCDFYNMVRDEEGDDLILTVDLLKMVQQAS